MSANPTALSATLAVVRERIARHRARGIGEQDTKSSLIAPILRALDWDLEDLDEVRLEYRRAAGDDPVDYALFLSDEPRLFLEAKALRVGLADVRWVNQVLSYATVAGVEWVALTDGDEWRIYNSHATVPAEQKLFAAVHVSDPGSRPELILALLAREQLAAGLIDALWNSELLDRRVGAAFSRLLEPEADRGLVQRIRAHSDGLSAAQVRASLQRLCLTFEPPQLPMPGPRRPVRRTGAPWQRVSLDQLIEARLLCPPLRIEHHSRRAVMEATIEAAGRILVAGTVAESLSTAAGRALLAARGASPDTPLPPASGWTFWAYRRADGSLAPLDELRREFAGRLPQPDRPPFDQPDRDRRP